MTETLIEKNCIESLCIKCENNGTTRIALKRIPYFKDIVIFFFECPHCGFQNNEIKSCSSLDERGGCRITLSVIEKNDLSRQIVKGEHATLTIKEIEFEIQPNGQGTITTIESILRNIVENLTFMVNEPKGVDPHAIVKFKSIIEKLCLFLEGLNFPFTIILDDPSGNSTIEPITFTKKDPNLNYEYYKRSIAQIESMGFSSSEVQDNELEKNGICQESNNITKVNLASSYLPNFVKNLGWDSSLSITDNFININKLNSELTQHENTEENTEVCSFDVQCFNCGSSCNEKVCEINIPKFGLSFIHAMLCESCGNKNIEVKSMKPPREKGKIWTLHVKSKKDLDRDIILSHNASVNIPELDLELTRGTLSGSFTTIEGLIHKIIDSFTNTMTFTLEDSCDIARKKDFDNFILNLKQLISREAVIPFTLIICDPSDTSMIGDLEYDIKLLNISDSDIQDNNLCIQVYTRSEEEDNELGLNINTDYSNN